MPAPGDTTDYHTRFVGGMQPYEENSWPYPRAAGRGRAPCQPAVRGAAHRRPRCGRGRPDGGHGAGRGRRRAGRAVGPCGGRADGRFAAIPHQLRRRRAAPGGRAGRGRGARRRHRHLEHGDGRGRRLCLCLRGRAFGRRHARHAHVRGAQPNGQRRRAHGRAGHHGGCGARAAQGLRHAAKRRRGRGRGRGRAGARRDALAGGDARADARPPPRAPPGAQPPMLKKVRKGGPGGKPCQGVSPRCLTRSCLPSRWPCSSPGPCRPRWRT